MRFQFGHTLIWVLHSVRDHGLTCAFSIALSLRDLVTFLCFWAYFQSSDLEWEQGYQASQERSFLNGTCVRQESSMYKMFLAFGAASVVFLSPNHPTPTPPPPQTFLIYMELSLLSFGPGTEPTLKCNEYNLEKKKKWLSRESHPFWRPEVMLQYCGVLLLKILLLFSRARLPTCNCHIWGGGGLLKG